MRRVLKWLAESAPSVTAIEWALTLWLNLVSWFKPLDKFEAKVTVVVPAYNVEPYIAQSMRSLRAQRYQNLRVILVDDHCTDRSIERARPFQSKFKLDIIRGTANGLGAARNSGVAEVGETDYLIFLDSDDVMIPGTLSKLTRLARKFDADIVNGQSAKFLGALIFPRRDTRFLYRGRKEAALTLADEPEMIYDSTPWNKLFSWKFWNEAELSWPIKVYFEDLIVSAKAFSFGAKVVLTPKFIYLWRERVGQSKSITQTHGEIRTLRDRVNANKIAYEFLLEAKRAGRIDDHAIEVFRKKLRDHDYAIYLPRYPNPDAEAKALLKEFAELAGIEG
jgi:CDP-glycerol glycerophosphotransferase